MRVVGTIIFFISVCAVAREARQGVAEGPLPAWSLPKLVRRRRTLRPLNLIAVASVVANDHGVSAYGVFLRVLDLQIVHPADKRHGSYRDAFDADCAA